MSINNNIKVYLDNVIVSAIGRHDLASSEEMNAVDQLQKLFKENKIPLNTSRHSQREIDRTQNKSKKDQCIKAFNNMSVIKNDHIVLGFHNQSDQYGGFISQPLISDIVNDKIFSQLTIIGLKKDDAMHLMYAIQNRFNYFLTTDPDFINKRNEIHKSFISTQIKKPSELLAELNKTDIRNKYKKIQKHPNHGIKTDGKP